MTGGLRLSSAFTCCLWLPWLAAAAAAEQHLGKHDSDADLSCVLLPDELPARCCAKAEALAPMVLWPLTQLRLHMVLDANSSSAAAAGAGLWSHLPLGGAGPRRPQLKHTAKPRWYCYWLPQAPMCRHCEDKPCSLGLQPSWDGDWAQAYEAFQPASGGCIDVIQLPRGANKAVISWDISLDWLVPVHIGVGLAFLWCWQDLQTSSILHASLGALGALLVVCVVAARWVARSFQGTLDGVVPFGRTLSAASVVLSLFAPALRSYLFRSVVPAGGWHALVDFRDPVYNLPLGKLTAGAGLTLVAGAVAFGANFGVRLFASPPELEGEVPFTIGPDGRRVDALPALPWSQRLLGWGFWLGGLALLLSSTHVDALSLAITAISLVWEDMAHFVWWRLSTSRGSAGGGLTQDQFQNQGQKHTARALAQLHAHLKANPGLVHNGRWQEGVELKLRRFVDEGKHIDLVLEDEHKPQLFSCTVL